MSTEATLSAITTARRESSSAAWFWWKETRQLAPLVALLIIVALLIAVLNMIMGIAINALNFRLPSEVTMLVFPGLFATGAGPLLVGQERSERTLNWLMLLPISARRLLTTKFFVALAGLAVMWIFALIAIMVFQLGSPTDPHWRIARGAGYSSNPFSYPVWISHSVFILLAGFYVAWRIENQFYSLVALIPLAFSPLILTSLVSLWIGRRAMTSELDWMNFAFTLLGIAIMVPLMYRAATRTLGPANAPKVTPLLGVSPHSPSQESYDAIAPQFQSQVAPIIWQSIHSARGTLVILTGMLLISLLAGMRYASIDRYAGIDNLIGFFLLAAPLAVCWLGVSVFKHDGSPERVRFLADRGVSHRKTYVALHAVPTAILCTSLFVYGIWNLTISHRESVSDFASGLPTLVTMLLFVVLIYSVSQWVSQVTHTLILSVILAPILSIIVVGWLTFTFVSLGFPIYGLVICGLAPLVATRVMMRRYMDNRDRPATFVVAAFVVALTVLLPIGYATVYVLSVPSMTTKMRAELSAEARGQWDRTQPYVGIGFGLDVTSNQFVFERDKMSELKDSLSQYLNDPEQIVHSLSTNLQSEPAPARFEYWGYGHWHGEFLRRRIQWQQDPSDQTWATFTPWLKASATLLPALRRSSIVQVQEDADRLEVLMIDTLQDSSLGQRTDDVAVQAAIASLGTPASRAASRRRAVLVSWYSRQQDQQRKANYFYQLHYDPPGLSAWLQPRREESQVMALLEGIEAARNHSDDRGWRLRLHEIYQTGGVFQTSRYGDRMRAMPAMETMRIGHLRGFGQLWGRAWEYKNLTSTDSEIATDR